MKKQHIEWILRIAIAGEFIGHGALALSGKQQWIGWIQKCIAVDVVLAAQLLFFIGAADIFFAVLILIKPIRSALFWMAFWGFLTALVRPFVGESVWDFVERSANWGAPLALFFLIGKPRTLKEWFS